VLANDGPVRQRLESVASEVSKAVDKELQASPGGGRKPGWEPSNDQGPKLRAEVRVGR
jgi:hypothetical protein